MISYNQALQIIQAIGSPLAPRPVRLEGLFGTVTSLPVQSPMTVPSFRNSAMDGFAVCVVDVEKATDQQPITLDVQYSVAAGDKPSVGQSRRTCEITTGAPVPEPYDAVVPVEEVNVTCNSAGQPIKVQFLRPARTKQNIREPGEDFQQGQTIIPAHVTLHAGHIMSLAALGLHTLNVRSAPKVHILSTGKEISDQYDTPLEAGKIYNSNSPYLLACCRDEGIEAQYGGIIADDVSAFHRALDPVPPGSVIITTGAVSKGRWDFIPEALKERGAIIHFHRVNIRPGKPVLFATLNNGSYYFGLPGNPISTAIGFRFFVVPLIHSLCDRAPDSFLSAQLENAYTAKGPFRHFLKSRVRLGQDGILRASVSTGQESFKIHPMSTCNAWVIAEEERLELKPGEMVPIVPFSRRLVLESVVS